MKYISKSSAMLIVLLSLFSCQKSSKQIEQEYISQKINSLEIGSNKKWVVILPGLGCTGCIQEGESFLKQHSKNKNITFLLTNIGSLKLLKQKIGLDVTRSPNIIIDKLNDFNLPSNNSIYPIIVELADTKVVKYEYQSPQNSLAFANLAEKLE